MVCLQSLGSWIDTLKTLCPLLEAGFTGREDKPQAIVEALRDYWDSTYANLPVRKGGWPSSVMTCLQSCGRSATAKPTPLPAPIGNVALVEKSRVPTLEPALTWGSSSTIAVEEDGASDATKTSQDSSPQRPSKTATVKRTDMIFSPLVPSALDFVVAPAFPATPSRQHRTPLSPPPAVPTMPTPPPFVSSHRLILLSVFALRAPFF